MIKQKNVPLIAGGVVVVLGAIWYGLGAYASSKAEDRLVAYLDKNGQRANVQWKSVSASIFGSATIEGVTIGAPGKPMALIERVKVSGVRDDRDRQSGDVVLENATLPDGKSPLTQLSVFLQAGKADLPAATLNVRWDYRRDDDKAEVNVGLRQPKALDADLALELDHLGPAVAAFSDPTKLAGVAMAGAFGGLGGLGRMDSSLASLAQVRVKSLNLKVKDDGYVQRSIVLFKRYNIQAVPGEGSAGKQRDKKFNEAVKENRKACESRNLMAGFKDNGDACKALANFLGGDDDTLKFETDARAPVSLAELLAGGMRDSQKTLALFSPTLSN
ncbi:hypothetical protein [Bordetella sp. N]|uniref:hypothetical protein n=1 Tax=Bordetella sp. N TaxID=1746199 RepID=UPI00070A838A|nr:hypothetical protein [Bordetella sp. N]ALM86561.1 hypothetical protein ASB57_29755 [Bordetella sp. N]